jgi:hypothetical protein
MKKTYSKPDIVFESFSLSTNIAAGCERKTNLHGKEGCGVPWGNSRIFTDTDFGCKSVVEDGSGKYDGLCYHNPSESYNVFNS